MKQPIIAAMLAVLVGPSGRAFSQEKIGPIELTRAAVYFAELEAACTENDGGRLWGIEVCGALFLVDGLTRKVVANRPDEEGLLVERDGVYVGKLPPEQPLANAPISWAGVRWAMIIVQYLSLEKADRITMLAHESFHRVQPALNLYPMGELNTHLAEVDGRYWMKLEWNALQAALRSKGEERRIATSDALAFRAARRDRYANAAARENPVEIREGLAQYAGLRIAGRTKSQTVDNVIARRAREDEIVSSFGYNSGPLYGYLLDEAEEEWRTKLSPATDLGVMLAVAFEIEADAARAERRAPLYDGAALRAAEEERELARLASLESWRDSLLVGPVLILDLSAVESATMDTRAVYPFDERRTVFTVRKLIAEWGVLEVDGGAILEDRSVGLGRVSLRSSSDDGLSGEGWSLQLRDGWEIAAGDRAGDAVLRRQP